MFFSNAHFSQSSLEEGKWKVQWGNTVMCCPLSWPACQHCAIATPEIQSNEYLLYIEFMIFSFGTLHYLVFFPQWLSCTVLSLCLPVHTTDTREQQPQHAEISLCLQCSSTMARAKLLVYFYLNIFLCLLAVQEELYHAVLAAAHVLHYTALFFIT